MNQAMEEKILQAFAELVERVHAQARIGLYETSYWFDDGSHLQVINFDELPAEEEGEEGTLDHTLKLQCSSFDILVIGFYSAGWSFQLEEITHPDRFLGWHAEQHPVVRWSGTD